MEFNYPAGMNSRNYKSRSVGLDLVEIARFRGYKKNDSFLKKVFTQQERFYCFSYKNPFPHLAGIFALKEAARKALGVNKFSFADIEVHHAPSGKPELWLKGRRTNIIAVSISHTDAVAGAVVIA